jgi:hypothetical protein
LTAIGQGYVATLSTNERGPLERRKAATWKEAFLAARQLLVVAEHGQWNRGELVRVEVGQSDG